MFHSYALLLEGISIYIQVLSHYHPYKIKVNMIIKTISNMYICPLLLIVIGTCALVKQAPTLEQELGHAEKNAAKVSHHKPSFLVITYKVVPPSYRLVYNPNNYRYNSHKSQILDL